MKGLSLPGLLFAGVFGWGISERLSVQAIDRLVAYAGYALVVGVALAVIGMYVLAYLRHRQEFSPPPVARRRPAPSRAAIPAEYSYFADELPAPQRGSLVVTNAGQEW